MKVRYGSRKVCATDRVDSHRSGGLAADKQLSAREGGGARGARPSARPLRVRVGAVHSALLQESVAADHVGPRPSGCCDDAQRGGHGARRLHLRDRRRRGCILRIQFGVDPGLCGVLLKHGLQETTASEGSSSAAARFRSAIAPSPSAKATSRPDIACRYHTTILARIRMRSCPDEDVLSVGAFNRLRNQDTGADCLGHTRRRAESRLKPSGSKETSVAVVALLDLRIKPESVPGAREFVEDVLVATRAFPGCLGVDVLVDVSDSAHLLLLERWSSLDADQAYREWRATAEGASGLTAIASASVLTRFVQA